MKNSNVTASIIYIDKEMINQRIDNFIRKKHKKLPKNMIYSMIRKGRIRINKKRIKPSYKLQIGDI
ncbi:RNA pseudouridine synthase, partial [Buchnera aphidicola]|nr:RNA pseudouridine synthase [Buchnera aphidicola]